MREYKIYSLAHPLTKEIRYIGATTSYLSSRFAQHKYSALKKRADTHVAKWFRQLYKQNLLPIISLIEICTKDVWEEREKYWIKQFNNLTNIREGGRGIVIDRSQEGRERSIAAHKKAVVLLSKEYDFIKEFDSCKACALYLQIGLTAVCNALHKNNSVAKGYIVLYKTDYDNNNYTKQYKGIYKTIYQYTLDGILLQTHKSVHDAYNSVNSIKYSSSIATAISKGGSSGGYFWSTSKITDFTPYQKKLKYTRKN